MVVGTKPLLHRNIGYLPARNKMKRTNKIDFPKVQYIPIYICIYDIGRSRRNSARKKRSSLAISLICDDEEQRFEFRRTERRLFV